MIKFTEDHEWVQKDGDVYTIGITAHAAEQLGDVVFVELPEVGATFDKGDDAGVVESVKAASEVYAPLAGEIVEVNNAIVEEPGKVNAEPQAGAWFFKMKLSDPSSFDALMDESSYKTLTE